MNGPEHYAEAERLIAMYENGDQNWAAEWGMHALMGARVHAALAQTAATVYAIPGTVGSDWAEATS